MFGSMGLSQELMNKLKNDDSQDREQSGRTKTDKQILLSLFEINIVRYALFIENIKPEHIDPNFMIDLMLLPDDYFVSESYIQYGKKECQNLCNSN